MPEPTTSANAFVDFVKQRWLAIIIVVAVTVFVLQNRGDVSVHLLWLTITTPNWLLLAIMFFLGVVAGAFRARRKHRAKK